MSTSQIPSFNALNQPLSGSGNTGKDNSGRQIQHTLRAGVLDALGVKGAGHGVRGIAAALRDTLANADPNAPDPVPSLLQTINTALDTAAKKLADQGIDQPTIDAAIKRFRSDLAGAVDALAPAGSTDSTSSPSAPAAPAATTNAAAVHAVTKEKFSLNILTAEGDQVSIRFRTSNVTDAAAAQTTGGAGTTTAADTHVISRGGLKVDVKGDLNGDEVKAIGDLLDKVDGIAKDFFGGDVQAAFGAAARVSYDSKELSGFNLKLSYSQRIGFAGTYAQTSPPTTAPAAPSAPAANPVVPPVSSAPVPAELDPISLQPTDSSDSAASAAAAPGGDAPVSTPAASDSTTSSAQQTITSFAKSVLARLAAVSDGNQAQFSLRWKVDFLLTALSASAPANDATATDATKALGDSLSNGVAAAS